MCAAGKKCAKLYLVRHGAAVPETENPEKPLSDVGRYETIKVAESLRGFMVLPDEIWHSARLRTRQTAGLLKDLLRVRKCFEKKNLLPGDDPGKLITELAKTSKHIMVVSHIPFVEKAAGLLLGGKEESTPVSFDTSSVACFKRCGGKEWSLEWLITPDVI
ncbi:histidine phosphatase family protein [bacterium]|jgi:phosphohistidine phosphatase|nr:histidine phosphatase family protein [bacterium]